MPVSALNQSVYWIYDSKWVYSHKKKMYSEKEISDLKVNFTTRGANMPEGFHFSTVTANFLSKEQITVLRKTTIGIAGAGGLGSNCAVALVRSGLERFIIADFDVVCASNLNRQAYGFRHIGRTKVDCLKEVCREINPAISITTIPQRIDETNICEIFSECDVVIEAFDNAAAKALLFNAIMPTEKLLVGASGIAGYGNSDEITIRKVSPRTFIVGDGTSGISDTLKPFAPRVTVAAAKMADIVLYQTLEKNRVD
jgi:sulfur carrier protein ThiS adenylyltransferase